MYNDNEDACTTTTEAYTATWSTTTTTKALRDLVRKIFRSSLLVHVSISDELPQCLPPLDLVWNWFQGSATKITEESRTSHFTISRD